MTLCICYLVKTVSLIHKIWHNWPRSARLHNHTHLSLFFFHTGTATVLWTYLAKIVSFEHIYNQNIDIHCSKWCVKQCAVKIIVQWSLAFVPITTSHQWWYSVHTLSWVNKGDFLNRLLHGLPDIQSAHCETRNCCNWYTLSHTVLVSQHPRNYFSLQAQCLLWQGIVTVEATFWFPRWEFKGIHRFGQTYSCSNDGAVIIKHH